jgi:hypothetical protein
MFKYNMLMS